MSDLVFDPCVCGCGDMEMHHLHDEARWMVVMVKCPTCGEDELVKVRRSHESVLEQCVKAWNSCGRDCNLQDAHNKIIEILAANMHYADAVPPTTAVGVLDSMEGGLDRYRSDSVFCARVRSIAAMLMSALEGHLK